MFVQQNKGVWQLAVTHVVFINLFVHHLGLDAVGSSESLLFLFC